MPRQLLWGARCDFCFLNLICVPSCNFLQLRPLGIAPPLRAQPRRCCECGGAGPQRGPHCLPRVPRSRKFFSALWGLAEQDLEAEVCVLRPMRTLLLRFERQE